MCVVIPRASCRGDFPSPADPPAKSLGSPRADGARLAKRLSGGIRYRPSDRRCTVSPLRHDRGSLPCSLDPWAGVFSSTPAPGDRGDVALPGPIEQGTIRVPCNRRRRAFQPLDPDRCFGTGFDRQGDFGSPYRQPIDQGWPSLDLSSRVVREAGARRLTTMPA